MGNVQNHKHEDREKYLSCEWWITCCACLPILGFCQGLICVIPCTFYCTISCLVIYIFFMPIKFGATVWTIFVYEGLGPTLKFCAIIASIPIHLLWPFYESVLALCKYFLCSLFLPVGYIFDGNLPMCCGPITKVFHGCFIEFTGEVLKFNNHEFFEKLKEWRDYKLPEGEAPTEIPIFQFFFGLVKGIVFGIICAFGCAFLILGTAIWYLPRDLYYTCWTIVAYKGWGPNIKVLLLIFIPILLLIFPSLAFFGYWFGSFWSTFKNCIVYSIKWPENMFTGGVGKVFTNAFYVFRTNFVSCRYLKHFNNLKTQRDYILPKGTKPFDVPLFSIFVGLIKGILIAIPCTICLAFIIFAIACYNMPKNTLKTVWTAIIYKKIGPTLSFVIMIIGFCLSVAWPLIALLCGVIYGMGYCIIGSAVYNARKLTVCAGFREVFNDCFVNYPKEYWSFSNFEYRESLMKLRSEKLPPHSWPFDIPLHFILLFTLYLLSGIIIVLGSAIIMTICKFIPVLCANYIQFWKDYFRMADPHISYCFIFFILGNLVLPIGVILGTILFLLFSLAMGVHPIFIAFSESYIEGCKRILNNVYEMDVISNINSYSTTHSILIPLKLCDKQIFTTGITSSENDHFKLYWLSIWILFVIPGIFCCFFATLIMGIAKFPGIIYRSYKKLCELYCRNCDDCENNVFMCCTFPCFFASALLIPIISPLAILVFIIVGTSFGVICPCIAIKKNDFAEGYIHIGNIIFILDHWSNGIIFEKGSCLDCFDSGNKLCC